MLKCNTPPPSNIVYLFQGVYIWYPLNHHWLFETNQSQKLYTTFYEFNDQTWNVVDIRAIQIL